MTSARYSWTLPECWQSKSDCVTANYYATLHEVEKSHNSRRSSLNAMVLKRVVAKVASQMCYLELCMGQARGSNTGLATLATC